MKCQAALARGDASLQACVRVHTDWEKKCNLKEMPGCEK